MKIERETSSPYSRSLSFLTLTQASVLMSEEGIAYIGSDSGEVLALDSATGK